MQTQLNEVLVQLKLNNYNYRPNVKDVLTEITTKGSSLYLASAI